MTKLKRAVISELLSVADLCREEPHVRSIISHRVALIVTGKAQTFPFSLTDHQIGEILTSLQRAGSPIGRGSGLKNRTVPVQIRPGAPEDSGS